ncbi:hypothetical protein SEA_ACOLYTE_76 [Mycobacterium phage Acolyte]|nr:hypothetical protein SEA_ACOLYTE_76 [Mycobacterium phage Acolyte]
MPYQAKCKACPTEFRAATARALGIAVQIHETSGHTVKVKEASQ